MTMQMMTIVNTITGRSARGVRHAHERHGFARALSGPTDVLAMAARLASAGTPKEIVISISVIVSARPTAGHRRPRKAFTLLCGGGLTRR